MVEASPLLALVARWVFPVAGPPVPGAAVIVRGTRIVEIGPPPPDAAVIDLGDAAIVPGLVNAHTHLEFSDLTAPLGRPGMALPEWIAEVIARRRADTSRPSEAIVRGLAECLDSGTTTVGEIATFDWRGILANDRPRPDVTLFRELIAPTRDRVPGALAEANAFMAAGQETPGVHPAISPHAPYTVHPELLAGLVELALRTQAPLAMHLAESAEELELLATRGGPFRDLLKRADAWDPRLAARLPAVSDYLEVLSRAPRALVIHGNYLSRPELEFLARRRERMSVVYCPRTHAYFGHTAYPLAEMLAAGVAIALGTDSRASNPDLSLWEDMRTVATRHPQVSPERVLALGTLAGAQALGVDDEAGTLAPGKLANLAVVGLENGAGGDPRELLFAPGSRVVQTWLRGQRVDTRRHA